MKPSKTADNSSKKGATAGLSSSLCENPLEITAGQASSGTRFSRAQLAVDIPVRLAFAAVIAACLASVAARPAVAQELTDPRDVLRQLGVDDDYFDRLADGVPINKQERESLLRVIHRLRKFPAEKLKKWALAPDLLETALLQPKDYRGQAFRLRGRILDVKPLKTPKEDAERYEMKTYYCCMLKIESLKQPIVVFTENVPNQWKNGAKPNADGGRVGRFYEKRQPYLRIAVGRSQHDARLRRAEARLVSERSAGPAGYGPRTARYG